MRPAHQRYEMLCPRSWSFISPIVDFDGSRSTKPVQQSSVDSTFRIRKFVETEYTYQSKPSIGPVEFPITNRHAVDVVVDAVEFRRRRIFDVVRVDRLAVAIITNKR